MAPLYGEPLEKKIYLTGKQTGLGEKLLRKLREERRVEFLPRGHIWRGYAYEVESVEAYKPSKAVKAKPPELPIETLKKEVKRDFQFLKGGAEMSKWKKSTNGRSRYQGHGFSLIEDKNGKGVHYYLDIRYPKRQTLALGKIAGRPIENRSDALNVAFEFVTKRFTELKAASSPDKTFSQLIDVYKEDLTRRKRRTAAKMIHRIRIIVEPHFGKMKLNEIKLYPHIESFRNQRQDEGVGDATIANELALARALFNKAIRKGFTTVRNPFEKIVAELGLKIEGRRRVMSFSEQEKLWPELAKVPLMQELAVFELNFLGRPHNILGLKWRQVSFEDETITISKEHFKTGRENMKILKRMWQENPNEPDDYVFVRKERYGQMVSIDRNWYQKQWVAACRRAGIENLRFYDLKRTAGTRLIASGTSTFQLKDMMNHRQLASTERYVGDNIEACKKELKEKSAILNGMNL